MDLSYFLAQLIGLSLALFALGALINMQLIKSAMNDFGKNRFVTLIIGFLIMVAGLAVVLSHNIWEMSWRVLVTLYGWGALIKGVTYIMVPTLLENVGARMFTNIFWMRTILTVALILGFFLTYRGFGF